MKYDDVILLLLLLLIIIIILTTTKQNNGEIVHIKNSLLLIGKGAREMVIADFHSMSDPLGNKSDVT